MVDTASHWISTSPRNSVFILRTFASEETMAPVTRSPFLRVTTSAPRMLEAATLNKQRAITRNAREFFIAGPL
jgi:hypothetical protein